MRSALPALAAQLPSAAQVLNDDPPCVGIAHTSLVVALWSLQDSAGAPEAHRGATAADPWDGPKRASRAYPVPNGVPQENCVHLQGQLVTNKLVRLNMLVQNQVGGHLVFNEAALRKD